MFSIQPLPFGKELAFAIRDDDMSYFTNPEILEKLYKNIFKRGYKVSFAVIPRIKSTTNLNVPPQYRGSNEYHTINQNFGLVKLLKLWQSEGKITVLLHGFCHTEKTSSGRPKFDFVKKKMVYGVQEEVNLDSHCEFYGKKYGEIDRRIRLGRLILEKTFKTPVNTFVSPQEFISRDLYYSLKRNRMHYCGSLPISIKILKIIPPNQLKYLNLIKFWVSKRMGMNLGLDLVLRANLLRIITLPADYRHYWNKYSSKSDASSAFIKAKQIIQDSMRKNGIFILLTHFWEYFYDWESHITQKLQYGYLLKILDFVSNNFDVWKCTVSDLFSWVGKLSQLKISRGRNCFQIYSKEEIKGLTIRGNLRGVKNQLLDIQKISQNLFIISKIPPHTKLVLY